MDVSVLKKKIGQNPIMGNSSYCPWMAAIFNFFKISYFYEKYAELKILSGNETNYQEFEKKTRDNYEFFSDYI